MQVSLVIFVKFIFFGCVWSQLNEKIIIFDTNAIVYTQKWFTNIISSKTITANPTATNPYTAIWDHFKSIKPDEIDTEINRVLEELQPNQKLKADLNKGASVMKLVLEMERISDVTITIKIPKFVFNELKGYTWKISEELQEIEQDNIDNIKNILDSIPIQTKNIDYSDINIQTEMPKKKEVDKTEKETMKEFLKEVESRDDYGLSKLVEHLKQHSKLVGAAQENIKRFRELSNYLRSKNKYDEAIAEFLKRHKSVYHETETKSMSSLSKKLDTISLQKIKSSNYNDPIDVIANRLTVRKEQLDFSDLIIYLTAKQDSAYILTFDKEVFQEINDLSFLEYFSDAKILNPDINFKKASDLADPKLIGIENMIERAIHNDLTYDVGKLNALTEIRNVGGLVLNPDMKREYFEKYFNELDNSFKEAKKFNELIEMPIFETVNFLKYENNENKRPKIDSKEIFLKLEDSRKIPKLLKCLDRFLFNSKLNPDDFSIADPSTLTELKEPIILFSPLTGDELKSKNLNLMEHSLNKLLETSRSQDPKAIGDMEAWVRLLHYLTHNDLESVKVKLLENLSRPKVQPIAGCPPSSRIRRRDVSECRLTWDDIDKFNDEHTAQRDAKKVQANSQKLLELIETIEDPIKRQQLYQFVDQLIDPANGYDGKLTGNSIPEVKRLVNRNKILDHFNRVGQVAGALNIGYFSKTI